ncbi:hypothetical protein [Nocardia rhamnosiphila]|uniref:hypothetical protein n=1 Tax=Nocardia rhamnosiphila TaxID=426716 RepID=UPI0007A53DF5|nr:hypothetical protein [Nocardia rhamnosiphila]
MRIQKLPHDAELVMLVHDGHPRWSDEAYLLADLFQAWTGKPHPARPQPRTKPGDSKREALRRRRVEEKRARDRARGVSEQEQEAP